MSIADLTLGFGFVLAVCGGLAFLAYLAGEAAREARKDTEQLRLPFPSGEKSPAADRHASR